MAARKNTKQPPFKEMTGKRVGRWTVLRRAGCTPKRGFNWLCRCACGTEKIVSGGTLRQRTSRSCGCLQREAVTKHGMAGTPIYKVWRGMFDRCVNPNDASFARYGGRGIKVCQRWLNFEKFLADVGVPFEGQSIDRIDNDGNYEPNNVRWETRSGQARNRCSSLIIEYCGNAKTVAQWATDLDIPYRVLWDRLQRGGWSPERAFTTPFN